MHGFCDYLSCSKNISKCDVIRAKMSENSFQYFSYTCAVLIECILYIDKIIVFWETNKVIFLICYLVFIKKIVFIIGHSRF